MIDREPKFSRKDIVISESPSGYDTDPTPQSSLKSLTSLRASAKRSTPTGASQRLQNTMEKT